MRVKIGNDLTELGFYIEIGEGAYFGDDINIPSSYGVEDKLRKLVRESVDKLVKSGELKIDSGGNAIVYGEGRPILLREYMKVKREEERQKRLNDLKDEEEQQQLYDKFLDDDE